MRELKNISLYELKNFMESLDNNNYTVRVISDNTFYKTDIYKEEGDCIFYEGKYYNGYYNVYYTCLIFERPNEYDFKFTLKELRKTIKIKERKEKISKLLNGI